MTRVVLVVSLLLACHPHPPATPPLPSTPPPPEPPALVPSARVSGRVVNRSGQPVAFASVLVKSSDGSEAGAFTDEGGEYAAVVGGRGPGLVVVEAEAGGASGSATAPVEFAVEPPAVRIDLRLDQVEPLTAAEAERLARALAGVINDPARHSGDLMPYILHGPEALRVAVDQYRKIVGHVVDIRPAPVESWEGHRFRFVLRGANGRETVVDVFQEDLIRIHSGLLDYGFRSERFINAYLRSIQSGDAEMLSRVMNPDDVDFPVEKAREMIIDYRIRFGDTAAIRPEFVDIDEKRNAIIWRLRAGSVEETIVLGFGDGLIGVRNRFFTPRGGG